MKEIKTSALQLKWKCRERNFAQTQRDYLDFVVDGQSLSEEIGGDLASCLGWFTPEENVKAVRRLLLEEAADFPNNRRSLYVCPECGDLGCGAVSNVVERIGNKIVWRDFGYENNCEESVNFEGSEDVGTFAFDEAEYRNVIESAL